MDVYATPNHTGRVGTIEWHLRDGAVLDARLIEKSDEMSSYLKLINNRDDAVLARRDGWLEPGSSSFLFWLADALSTHPEDLSFIQVDDSGREL